MEKDQTLSVCGLPLKIRRHPRARRIILRLAPDGSELQLTLPRRTAEKTAIAFVQAQQDWIRRQQQRQGQQMGTEQTQPALTAGAKLLLFGAECELVHDPARKGIHYDGLHLQVGGEAPHFTRRVTDWIRQEARKRFSAQAVSIAAKIGERPSAVSVRDTRSRWGSCSHTRRISLSWRLAFAPAEIAEYVIAHEVAHLKVFDHSPAFWQVVATLHPGWQRSRHWLQQHSRTLHAIR